MNTNDLATAPRNEKFIHLLGDLEHEVKTLIKTELELAKTEMGEKFKVLGRNAGFAAGGGILLLSALFILLLALGAIAARLLQNADISPGTADFLAYTGLAIILGGVGYALLHKALHAFSEFSLSPQKALNTVRTPEPTAAESTQKNGKHDPKPSSDQLQDEALATRARMDSEIAELKSRLTPGYVMRSSVAGVKHHPLRALVVGATTGLGGYLLWRHQHQAKVLRLNAHRKWWQLKAHA